MSFTRRRGVPLVEWEEKWDEAMRKESLETLQLIRERCAKDRDLYEKSVTGFVANVRVSEKESLHLQAYRNHDCNFILRFDDLDLASLARSFALVQLPKMSEFKKKKIEYEEMGIDVQTIPYLDPVREQARQERLKKEAQTRAAKALKEPKAKSVKRSREEAEEESKKKKKGKHEKIMNEWEELQEEERLFRMFKQKKISEEEYTKRLLSSKPEEEETTFEKRFEKLNKDHQMLRNTRKSRQSHKLGQKGPSR